MLNDLTAIDTTVEVRGERSWPHEAASPTQPDLLVLTKHAALMIENKRGSGESGDGQYTGYKTALRKLATARTIDVRAYLLTPDASTVPDGWHGSLTHIELADVLYEAASEPEMAGVGPSYLSPGRRHVPW